MSKLKNIALGLKQNELLKDSFWALFGNVIAKGLALVAGVFVAKFLGNGLYGEYGMIRNTLTSIAIFATIGLGYTSTKFIAEFKDGTPEYLSLVIKYSINITLILSSLMSIGLFFNSDYIAKVTFDAPHLSFSLKLMAIWIVFNALTTTQIGILAGFKDFKGMARANTVVGIVTFILSCGLTYNFGFEGALAALLITQILNYCLNYRLVKINLSKSGLQKKHNGILLKDLLKFSLPIALQESLFPITSWLISLMLIRLSGFGELGLYSAAMLWNALILYVPGILRNVVLSHLSENLSDESKHKNIMQTILLLNFVMSFIPCLIVFFLSDYIASFYGDSFENLSMVINVAVFTTIFSSLSNVYAQAYLSKGKNWLMFRLRFFRDFGIVLIGYYIIIESEYGTGAISIISASLIMNFIFLLMMVFFYKSDKISI